MAAPAPARPAPGWSLQIQAAGLEAQLAQVSAAGWPPLRGVRLTTGPIVCTVGTAGVRLAAEVQLVAELTEAAANAALQRLPTHPVRQLRLVCSQTALQITGRYRPWRWLDLGFAARGQVAVAPDGRFNVVLDRLDLVGFKVPARARQVVAARLQQRLQALLARVPWPAGFCLGGIDVAPGCLVLRADWRGEGSWPT